MEVHGVYEKENHLLRESGVNMGVGGLGVYFFGIKVIHNYSIVRLSISYLSNLYGRYLLN